MAGLLWVARWAPVATGTSTKTIVQIVTPTNQRAEFLKLVVGFGGTDSTAAPIQLDILKQSSAGTSSALTLNKYGVSYSETIQCTALEGFSGTEPTSGDIQETFSLHPQSTLPLIWTPDVPLVVPGGTRMALRVATPGASVTCYGFIVGRE